MVTRPLDLLSHVRKPTARAEWLHFINVGLIALFFVVFGSRFVISPGIVVSNQSRDGRFTLPVVAQAIHLGSATSIVISVAGPDLVFAEDGKYTFAEIRQWLAKKGREHPGARLLLRTDAGLALGDFTEIVSAADSAGLVVLLAAEPSGAGRRNTSSAPVGETIPLK
ncbi:MAG: hypothetical protein K1X42_03665 [Opitutaceae bacterium]|nr:hypothetical protein [Opitutaceae bacterium]